MHPVIRASICLGNGRTRFFFPAENLALVYGFVVAGGGQAGIVVASRLTENSDISVLLLEAGSSNLGIRLVMTPPFAKQLHTNGKYDWMFQTEDQVGTVEGFDTRQWLICIRSG
jgi:choline dehydrogenase-like flavoprotein